MGLLHLILIGAALLGTAVIAVKVYGVITKKKIQEAMLKKGIYNAITREVDQCSNTINLDEINGRKKLQIQGDGIADDIRPGQKIHA